MIDRYARALCLVALATGLSGCGLTSSPADNLTFHAPAGWQGSPGIMGFMQFWKAPGNDAEVLMLFKSPKPMDQREVFNNAKLNETDVEQQQAIKICGSQPAEYIKARGESNSGAKKTESEIEMVMTNAAGNTYFAMYVYPVGVRPNAEASASLRVLCPKT